MGSRGVLVCSSDWDLEDWGNLYTNGYGDTFSNQLGEYAGNEANSFQDTVKTIKNGANAAWNDIKFLGELFLDYPGTGASLKGGIGIIKE